jgi:hypothetical protein
MPPYPLFVGTGNEEDISLRLERVPMTDEQLPKHAVRIRWRSFHAEIIGWPAVIAVAIVGALALGIHILNLLNYLPRLP